MSTNIALPIRRFFEQHLVAERGLSQHTILSYRDTLKLLLTFATKLLRKHCEELTIEELSADLVRKFLADLEKTRRNSVRTRNARLAAIHAFFRYLATVDPRLLARSQSVLGIPFKRYVRPVLGYMQREEVINILGQIKRDARYGRRDDAILRALYNTGARAQEIANIDVPDIRFSRPYLVHLHGKDHDSDQVLSAGAIDEADRSNAPLLNRHGARLTRFGLRYIVGHRVAVAGKSNPRLLTRKIGPHTWRHTTGMHLLQSGVDLDMIRSWLGHSSIQTTHEYIEVDLEMKRKTLKSCENLLPKTDKRGPSWQRDAGILKWLSRL